MLGSGIDYGLIANRFLDRTPRGTLDQQRDAYHEFLFDELPVAWCEQYGSMPGASTQIVEFDDHGFRFLFDVGPERVVAAFGLSDPSTNERDRSRMAGFLGKERVPRDSDAAAAGMDAADERMSQQDLAGMTFRDRFSVLYGGLFDRGHFMSHTQGGGLDVNLFPQRADINQGRSSLGREYRAMERRCATRPGVFCFNRPIYDDDSWVPSELEYGLTEGLQVPDVRVFPNK